MSQELIPQPITVLIPSEDVQKFESGEISLETLKRGKNGRFIKQLDTLKADNSFYSKNTTIQVLNNYIFTESLYSKKLKAEITIISNQLKKNEQSIQKLIQLKFNDIEAKVIKFNSYIEQNLHKNPIFTNKEVIHVGMDTISTLTANFSYLRKDFINSTKISYNWGREKGTSSLLDFNQDKNNKYYKITKTEFEIFSDHIIYFITLSLLNTINDVNLTNFKETGNFLSNWNSDLNYIKAELIDTLNILITGFKEYDDIYNVCYHLHNNKFFPLQNLEKIISLDQRENINIHQLMIRDFKATSDSFASHSIDHNRINSVNTIISLIDLCDEITTRLQTLEEIQEGNPNFNTLLLDLAEYSITLSESGDN